MPNCRYIKTALFINFERLSLNCVNMKLALLFSLLYVSMGSFVGIFQASEGQEHTFFCPVKRVLKALEKAVSFYEEYEGDLNLDACFGLRIAEG